MWVSLDSVLSLSGQIGGDFRLASGRLVGVEGVVESVEDQGWADDFGEVVAVEVGTGVPGQTSEAER